MNNDTELVKRIKVALENPRQCVWLPDVTPDLVGMGWHALYEETGLSPSHYGTSNVLTRSVLTRRNVVGHLSTSSIVEVLDPKLASHYEDAQIQFYTAEEIRTGSLLACVEDALRLIKRVPSLHKTVTALISSFHLIKPKDRNYDVSFSEPYVPFSIFISVPQNRSPISGLRVAEAIVHEGMHLQLTLIERFVPLVEKTDKKIFSPWRDEYRTVQGVMHALYVFRVVNQFLETLSIQTHPPRHQRHIQSRSNEIDKQIRAIRPFQGLSELTMIGASFVQSLIQD